MTTNFSRFESAPRDPLHPSQARSFEEFRLLATDERLSRYERIGFPDDYRAGREQDIFEDIVGKLDRLRLPNQVVLDIGPGCSDLPCMLIDLCEENDHSLVMIDSHEMLSHLPERRFLDKVPAMFPDCDELIGQLKGKTDVILCYSVMQCVMVDTCFFRFLDVSMSLLAPGGQMLVGDLPNVSKRKRFFASSNGVEFHQRYTQSDTMPDARFNQLEPDTIDDAVVFAILQRCRLAGFDAYVMPQRHDLPMANRREDVLIVRP